MELYPILLTGVLSGLASVLANSVAWSTVAIWRPPRGEVAPYAVLDIPAVLLHLIAGVGLGFLFWLSWGLAAVVDVPWWLRGLAFGSLCWLALAAPALIGFALATRAETRATAAVAAQWALTCLVTGLACAWHWANG
ncbi:MAG: hypothetical protein DIU71_09495 [Proteobacteria bacterium]|nr:MAG: hypothetical protein DIU71_09495 [Pseudomonadota bacterium]